MSKRLNIPKDVKPEAWKTATAAEKRFLRMGIAGSIARKEYNESKKRLTWTENNFFGTTNAEIAAKTKPGATVLKKIATAGFKWSPWAKKWVKREITNTDREFCRTLTGNPSAKSKNKKPTKKTA
jgi:hypothetical protein